MTILSFKNLYFSVGEFAMLDHVSMDIHAKERIALIGRNGEGKSTLMKILAKEIPAQGGDIIASNYVKVSRLAQDLPPISEITVYEYVAQGLQQLSNVLVRYHDLIQQPHYDDPNWLNQLHVLQEKIETQNGWLMQERIDRICQDLKLPQDKKMSDLSGGWRRRVALAQALVQEPDVLLLDEPTNHLDIEAIQALEQMLLNYNNTLIFITHDRALLRKIATRIVELDRGQLKSYPADYDLYLKRKAEDLAAEERANALFDKKLSDEEQWIRQGIKARRTRNEGRVRALMALRDERKLRRTIQSKPDFELNEGVKSGKMIVQIEQVTFGYRPGKPLIKDFSFNIQRGDKIAIVGSNGAGKTTLIKLMLGLLTPTSGTIKISPTVQFAFFDQNRDQIMPDETVMANVAQGDDFVENNGQRKHVIGYLGDFLFSPAKCRQLANVLSGGEQNRLMLAKLFAKPANLLVLDEPTNDLDIESLDTLENLLLNYSGTVIIISHDREFIDNVATHTIAIEKDRTISVNVGGYTDWAERQKTIVPAKSNNTSTKQNTTKESSTGKKKLSYNEQRELEALPARIESLEKAVQAQEAKMCEPSFYLQNKDDILVEQEKMTALQAELSAAYSRWEVLDNQS